MRAISGRWIVLFGVAVTACGGGSGGAGGGPPDTTAPTVSSTIPTAAATAVAIDVAPTVKFSEVMNGATITAATFTLSGGVTGLVSYSGTTATLSPSSPLAYSTTYTATVAAGVKDAAGNPLASPYTWTFTTGAAPPGALDTSFNGTGTIVTSLGAGRDEAYAVAIQPDGKIVVAGRADLAFGLARYDASGSLDPTFGSGGKVKTFLQGAGSVDVAGAVAIQADGKIVAAGSSTNNFAVTRYHPDGTLDLTFDTDGKATSSLVDGVVANTNGYAVALQQDGKIVVGGSWTGSGGGSAPWFALGRFNADGSLDTTFNVDGIVRDGSGSVIQALAIQVDGKIVAAGPTRNPSTLSVARYLEDGSLDPAFGTLGAVTVSVAYETVSARALVIEPGGRIVVAGNVGSSFAAYRFTTDGALEAIFDQTPNAQEFLTGVARQADGKLVAAGYRQLYINVDANFVLRRWNTDGSFDLAFGTGGRVETLVGNGYLDGGHAVAIQPDGRIVVVGSATKAIDDIDFVVARYWP